MARNFKGPVQGNLEGKLVQGKLVQGKVAQGKLVQGKVVIQRVVSMRVDTKVVLMDRHDLLGILGHLLTEISLWIYIGYFYERSQMPH